MSAGASNEPTSGLGQLRKRASWAAKRRISMPEWQRPSREEPILRRTVFCVEDTTVQLVWGNALPGMITIQVEAASNIGGRLAPRHVTSDGGPGGIVVSGLRPGTSHTFVLSHEQSRDWSDTLRAVTLTPPPGESLGRIATISDMHIGSRAFGGFHTMVTRPSDPEPHSLMTARGALSDLLAWPPDHLVIKGDMTDKGTVTQWSQLHDLVDPLPFPILGMPGNHERYEYSDIDPAEGWRRAVSPFADPIVHLDIDGARLIAIDTSEHEMVRGTLERCREETLDLVAESPTPVLLFMHHPLERRPVPSQYPLGIPWDEAASFRRDLARAHPATLVTCGHTHRNRVHHHGPLVLTEVASTKDYPGVWGGYVIHEGGIRQMVRRTTEPAAMTWTEYSRWALGGAWGKYSPGTMSDRCFSHTWPVTHRTRSTAPVRMARSVSPTS